MTLILHKVKNCDQEDGEGSKTERRNAPVEKLSTRGIFFFVKPNRDKVISGNFWKHRVSYIPEMRAVTFYIASFESRSC